MDEDQNNLPSPDEQRAGKPKKDFLSKNSIYIFLIIWIGLIIFYGSPFQQTTQAVSYSQFLEQVNKENVTDLVISPSRIQGKFKEAVSGQDSFTTIRVEDDQLVARLNEKNVKFTGAEDDTFWTNMLSWLLPVALLIGFWYFIFTRMARSARGNFMSLGKSKAKIYVERDVKIRFTDVAGVDSAKDELREVVDFLKNPDKYSRLGGHVPKGILLVGPPGTGKTLLARAVAGESQVPFYSINGSEFVEMFVGLGAARVRDLFETARKNAPCIIFVDELDALGKSRALSSMAGSSNDEKEQTLNQLLAELDGFDSSEGIVLLSATNRPEVLDPALLRAGRFDRQVLVDNPDKAGRESILNVHAQKIKLHPEIDLGKVAAITAGFSGADLANLVNEAALAATRRNAKSVELKDFNEALERMVAGLEQKRKLINPEERKRVAFHEMGHATVALALGCRDTVHKISIIPRGIGALGYTLQRPSEDRYLVARKELMTKIATLLGGRTAEELFFDDISTGAGDDLNKASDLARAMVTQYGMSEKLGLATYEQPRSRYLQAGLEGQRKEFSEETATIIDGEIKRILDESYLLAEAAISANRPFVEACGQKLLEKEVLDDVDIDRLWRQLGKEISLSGQPKKAPKIVGSEEP